MAQNDSITRHHNNRLNTDVTFIIPNLFESYNLSVCLFVCFRDGLWQSSGCLILQYLLHRDIGLGFSVSLLLFQLWTSLGELQKQLEHWYVIWLNKYTWREINIINLKWHNASLHLHKVKGKMLVTNYFSFSVAFYCVRCHIDFGLVWDSGFALGSRNY